MTADELEVGRAYVLREMSKELWTAPHPYYGTPDRLAGKYIGSIRGERRWHGFEVWADGVERGVIFMTDQDLEKIEVTELVE